MPPNSEKKKVDGIPVPGVPLTAMFYMFFIGIYFVCLLIDSWLLDAAPLASSTEMVAISKMAAGFYYRKELVAPIWYKGIMLLFFVGGVISHIRLLISLILRKASLIRSLVDASQIATYGTCVYYSITSVRRLEREIGAKYTDFNHSDVMRLVGEMQFAHLVLCGLFLAMLVIQLITFKVQHANEKEKND